jgi:hypothetical protein
MTMYEYVAMSNPRGAKSLIESFGYRVTNPRTMGSNLRMLVAQEGEEALKAIADLHPDKEFILEACSKPEKKENFMGVDGILSVEQARINERNNQANVSDSTKLAYQTNAMMVVVAIVIASAIIVNQRK